MTHSKVLSIANGTFVGKGETSSGAGKYVIIQYEGGAQVGYWHLRDFSAELKGLTPPREIPRGFRLGFAGSSGGQKEAHLHMELRTGMKDFSNPYDGTRASWSGEKMDG